MLAYDPEMTKFIVAALGRHNRPDDITRAVCERTGLKWDEARQLIEQVQRAHQGEITGRQNGWLRFIAIATITAGLAISLSMFFMMLTGTNITFRWLPIPYIGNVIALGVGVAMTAGGISGMLRQPK